MNSQIFQTDPHSQSNNASTRHRTIGTSPVFHWLSAIFLIAAVILFPERPAWGNDFDIHIGPNGIRGYADEIELADVLEVIADEGGYTFYLDYGIDQTRISFNIPDAIPAEKAIGKIVRSFSHVIIFAKAPNGHTLQIEQVRIYFENPDTINATPSPEIPVDPADQNQEASKLLAAAVSYDK